MTDLNVIAYVFHDYILRDS